MFRSDETDLNASGLSGAFHARSHVNGIAPNVVMRFGSSDDAGRNWAMIDT